jgi:predicted anti-sigma-YlaC factor YlaD
VTCSSSETLFEAYLDDTLLPAQRARLLGHLRGCGRCTGVLDELRVVDALLATPRAVDLPENFTFATMAEARSLPRPHVSRAPVLAYVVSYLVAAWLVIAAAFVLAWPAVGAFGETALDGAAELARTIVAVGHAGSRVVGDFGPVGTLIGAAVAVDVAIAVAVIVGFALVRPRSAERARW